MKESVEVIQGADHCHIRLSLRVTSGQECRKKHKNMLKSVINAKSSLQIFISLRAY